MAIIMMFDFMRQINVRPVYVALYSIRGMCFVGNGIYTMVYDTLFYTLTAYWLAATCTKQTIDVVFEPMS